MFRGFAEEALVKFGLLGTGYWAAEAHGAGLATHPDVEFVGVWGRGEAKAEALASRYGVRAYGSVEQLLDDVDAVAIALPPDIQAPLAVQAAEAGRHLLLDKPIALSTADADRLVDAVSGRVASVVFFTRRFSEPILSDLDRLSATEGWVGAEVRMFGSIFRAGSPFAHSDWRKEAGGLWDIGPHALSVLLPVLGRARAVTAVEGPHRTSHLLLEHEAGAVSRLALTLEAPVAMISGSAHFYGEAGIVELATPVGDPPVVELRRAVTELIAAAGSDRRHPCDVHFGAEVVRILEAAQSSIKTGSRQLL